MLQDKLAEQVPKALIGSNGSCFLPNKGMEGR